MHRTGPGNGYPAHVHKNGLQRFKLQAVECGSVNEVLAPKRFPEVALCPLVSGGLRLVVGRQHQARRGTMAVIPLRFSQHPDLAGRERVCGQDARAVRHC